MKPNAHHADAGLPEFKRPPVVETVLGVQFNRLPGYTTAHAGLFWHEYLGQEWNRATEMLPLEDKRETFDSEGIWLPTTRKVTIGIGAQTLPVPNRVLIARRDDERVVQLQASQFLYNWRKRTGEYPRYATILPEYLDHLDRFRTFAQRTELGTLALKQWEVTYVNHIPKGSVWNTPSDLHRVLPWFAASEVRALDTQRFETANLTWLAAIDERARLRVTLQHVRVEGPSDPEVIVLNLTARGPLNQDGDLENGLNLGHEAIVRNFSAMTSGTAHDFWGKTR